MVSSGQHELLTCPLQHSLHVGSNNQSCHWSINHIQDYMRMIDPSPGSGSEYGQDSRRFCASGPSSGARFCVFEHSGRIHDLLKGFRWLVTVLRSCPRLLQHQLHHGSLSLSRWHWLLIPVGNDGRTLQKSKNREEKQERDKKWCVKSLTLSVHGLGHLWRDKTIWMCSRVLLI